MKVAPRGRAAGHGHGGKGGGFIPPHGDNTPPKAVAPTTIHKIFETNSSFDVK